MINPAAVSSDFTNFNHNLSFGFSTSLQWASLESAAYTTLLGAEYLLEGNNASLIIGGQILQDKIGPTAKTGIYGRIAGVISDGDPYFGGLSIGLNIGAAQFRIKTRDIQLVDFNDVLGNSDQQKIYPDIGAGIYFYKKLDGGGVLDEDNIFFGLSAPQLVSLDLAFVNELGEFNVTQQPHYFAQIGLTKYFGEGHFFEPVLWARYAPGLPLQIDLIGRLQLEQGFWLGVGGSNNKAFHLETGFLIGNYMGWDNQLKIGYGYDYSFTSFGPFVGAIHELNLAFSLEK